MKLNVEMWYSIPEISSKYKDAKYFCNDVEYPYIFEIDTDRGYLDYGSYQKRDFFIHRIFGKCEIRNGNS